MSSTSNWKETLLHSGELRLVRPLSELISISHSNQPILLTVVAEEVRENPEEPPAQSTTVRLALIPPGVKAGSPTFGSTEYHALLDENSPTGTVLKLPQANVRTQPGDVVTLVLENNNGTFEISPSVVEGEADFEIRVHDPKLLDYESRKSVTCDIIAKEIGTGNFTAKVKLTVLLNDVNDNPPEFLQVEFEGSVPENAEAGTTVLRVEATDIDSEPGNKIRYTALTGPGVNKFKLNPETGIITVATSNSLDAETTPIFEFKVEATDEDGKGKKSYGQVKIRLIDINDESPIFEKDLYEFIVNMDRTGFTSNAVIKAFDKDISPPNNEIHYEIVNPLSGVVIDELTGELGLTSTWRHSELINLNARAWDGGIPRLSGVCEIRIYPPEANSRKMIFIVPGKNPDVEAIAKILRTITGGNVSIDDVRPYKGHEPGATDISRQTDTERSVVEATVTYSKGTTIDVKKIQEILDHDYRERHRNSELREAEGGSLLWLLLLLFFLLLLLALLLLCCCLWDRCPCYAWLNRRRKVRSVEAIKIIADSPGQGHESKSVQVAEWFGRREAWSPEPATLEAESLRRHEVERGSDRSRVQFQRQQQANEYYVREGNADILRLYTSKEKAQRPVTLVAENSYLPDSGKDILMRRFMEQQQSDVPKQQEMLLPNAAVCKLQSEHEALEASLRQQNALLKQILHERERDLKLETQSLPAGTQTDIDAGTQTDPHLFLPPRREVQSNDEQSEGSDEDLAIIKEKVKRRNGYRADRVRTKRRIRTPIQEEPEKEIIDEGSAGETEDESPRYETVKQTKTSELRQKRASAARTQSGIRREVLREISESLYNQELEREMREKDIREDILLNLSSSLNRRNRASSESRLSRSAIRRDIMRDLSNTLSRQSRTASETRLFTSEAERDIIREITDSINRQNELTNLLNRATQVESEPRLSRSALRREILQEISSAIHKPDTEMNELLVQLKKPSLEVSEIRRSKSGIVHENLTKNADATTSNEGVGTHTHLSGKRSRAGSISRLSGSGLKRELLQELVNSIKQSNVESKSRRGSAAEENVLKNLVESLNASKKRSVSESRVSKAELKREILRELSATLNRNEFTDDGYSDDSLEGVSPNSGDTVKSNRKVKYHSELDLRMNPNPLTKTSSKSKSQDDLTKIGKSVLTGNKSKNGNIKTDKNETKDNGKNTAKQPRRQSRYMEWYNKNKNNPRKKPTEKASSDPAVQKISKDLEKEKVEAKVSQRLLKETESSARKKQAKKKTVTGPEHPLLQHSEHRFEANYPRRTEDDVDSGIAMSRPPIAQKKSVFTIAYNDMHTSQIHDTTAVTPP